MKHIFSRLISAVLFPLICAHCAWGADTNTPTSGSTYRFKATVGGTSYYLVAPTSTGIGTVSTTESEGTVFTFTQESSNWYITFTSGTTTYYMYESGSNGQVSISTNKTKVNTVTTNGDYTKIGGSKWIQFNNASNPKRMGCYSSTQTGVMLSPASSCSTTLSTPSVTPTAGDKQIMLTWASIVHASSYSVTCTGGGTIGSIGGTTTKSCIITGLTNGTEYTWKVKAIGTGIYCDSEEASGNTTPTAPPIDVTLHYKGTTAVLINQTNPYTLPTTGTYVADACDAWTFDGWYNSSYAKNTSKPTYITQLTSTGSAYAVYKHTETSGASTPITRTMNSFDAISGYVGGDANISYAAAQGSAGTAPVVNSNIIRIYQNGGTLTVTANNGKKITRVTIGSSMGTTVRYQVDGGAPSSNRNISANGTVTTPEIDGGANSVTFTCKGTTSSTRLYLNYLSVTYSDDGGSTTYYSTDAECGPNVQATASPWVTSTQGQYVKVEVPVTATNFDKSSTLSASVSGAGFSIVGWGANGNSVTKDVDLTTSLILAYNPSAYNTTTDATITFSSNYSGSQTPVYTNGTVHGRSLPEKFVIAIKQGDQWLALPANMPSSSTYAGVEVNVDNTTNPTKVTAGPATALYSLLNVYKTSGAGDRYADYGTRVRFLGNEKCLWSNTANTGTGISNGAVPVSATSDNYEWTLVTTDGVTYAINTNVQQKIDEGRELRYRAGESRFGMYTDGNNSFRFLPVDCDSRATVTNVESTYNTVTLTWTGKSGTDYNVYIDEGGVTKKTETNVTSPVTISGLSSATNYTWIISPGAKDADCALSGNFTTNVAPIHVTLSCDGTEYPLGEQDKPYTLPTTGTYVNDACAEWEFVGWTNGTYSKSTSAPTLITQMNADGTAYAVYSHTEGGGSSSPTTVSMTTFTSISGNVQSDENISYEAQQGDASTAPVVNSDEIRIYQGGGLLIITPNNGKHISSITIGSSMVTSVVYKIGSGAYTDDDIDISAGGTHTFSGLDISSSFTIKCTGADKNHRLYLNNLSVTYSNTSSGTTYYSTSSECCNEVAPPTVTVEPVDVRATISWVNQLGAENGYHVSCSNGTEEDVAAGVTSLVITGLSASTSYDYTVTAKGATCNRSVEGSFTTSSCSDVPTSVIVTPGTHTATIRWTALASTATVVIYDDDLGTSIVKTVENQTSPCTITGLNDNTDYYLQVFAGGTCPHPIKPFTTQSTAVEVAEWYPNGININLNADEATATVLIEDKQEKAAASTSYADGLFFSKYYEAYLSVKLWAIYNGTPDKISLANVVVKSANNGNYWAKDNTTGTGAENAAKITSLATFGHFETGYIYPGEEIIVYNPGQATGTQDHEIIECMEATYGTAYKDDPDSVWYLIQNQTTALSGDDGLILLDGIDTLDVIGGKDAHEAWLNKAQPSWGDAAGWTCNNGEDVDGNTIGLSTNRCLLVRKNTVKSGLNAVANNTDNFYTLCDEWWGAHVPEGGDQVQTSCDNFSYVGHYDYNNYYAQFDSVTTVEELSGFKNEDGTYRIPIPQLDTLSCTMLRVKVYEGTEEKASAEYKVPIMVEGNKQTNDEIFKKHEVPTCKECDVVILKNATLEKTSGANDRDEIRNLTIYPGGTLIVPSGKGDYTVQSVQFRVEKETAPVAKLNGNLITQTEQVIVSRRIKNDRFYFFSLPYDCNIADIRWSNGETPVRGVDYEIVEYDGARRALEGSTQGAPGHWTPVSGTQLKAGVGYNIAVASDIFKELVFPMDIGQTNLTNKENTKTAKTVAIHQYTNAGTTINNHNWNLVAHPYVSAFSAYEGDYIKAGKLVYTEPANPGDKGTWHRDEETTNVYLTMPSFNSGGITYTQTVSTDISQLDPFLAVFVQGAGEGDLTFEQSARKLSAPARHLAAKAEDEDESIFAGVILSGNGESDQTNLRIRPDFTDEYQLGYDLEKFITFYTSRPQVYMKTPSYRLAFQAVSDEVAKSTFLPMGVYCYQAGTYTFTLSDRYPIDEIEAVYLFDKQTGVTTNLLYDSYSFTATKQVYTNTRFSLNVIVKRRILESPTGVENLEAPDSMVRKILIDGHVYIQRGKAVYDLTGKSMLNQ